MESAPRVRLRPLRDEDVPRLIAFCADPELVATMGWRPFAPDEAERFRRFTEVVTLPGARPGENRVFGVLAGAGDTLIGYAALRGIASPDDPAEVGIAIMDGDYRGRGCGTEALRRLIEYAFRERGLRRLGLTVFEANRHAVKTYEKLGFRRTARLRDAWELPDGGTADLLLMELRREPDD